MMGSDYEARCAERCVARRKKPAHTFTCCWLYDEAYDEKNESTLKNLARFHNCCRSESNSDRMLLRYPDKGLISRFVQDQLPCP